MSADVERRGGRRHQRRLRAKSGTSLDDCLWPLDRRDELTAALASAAGIAQLRSGRSLRAQLRRCGAGAQRAGARRSAGGLCGWGAAPARSWGSSATRAPTCACWRRAARSSGARARRCRRSCARRPRRRRAGPRGGRRAGGLRRGARANPCATRCWPRRSAASGWRKGRGSARAQRSIGAALRAAGVGRRLGATLVGYRRSARAPGALWGDDRRARGGGRRSARRRLGLDRPHRAPGRRPSRLVARGRPAGDRRRRGAARSDPARPLAASTPSRCAAAGIGRLMGRVADVEAVESLALGGGLTAAVGIFELVTGLCVLGDSAWRRLGELALRRRLGTPGRRARGARAAGAAGLVGASGWRSRTISSSAWSGSGRWSRSSRPSCGTAARIARSPSTRRGAARSIARWPRLTVLVPRGWLIGALVHPGARDSDDPAPRPGAFAASLGGILFVSSALRKLTQAFPALGAAAIAWRNIGASAGGRRAGRRRGSRRRAVNGFLGRFAGRFVDPRQRRAPPSSAAPLIEARALGFRYPGRPEPVLEDCASRFAAAIGSCSRAPRAAASRRWRAALRAARADLGQPAARRRRTERARRRALARRASARRRSSTRTTSSRPACSSTCCSAAPGRRRREDVAEAEAICRELDLGPLLARMPSGLEQLVGESGWQLSHGERSRLFIARSLLQPLDRPDARRELRRARSRRPRTRARLRAQPRGDPARHRAPVVRRSRIAGCGSAAFACRMGRRM